MKDDAFTFVPFGGPPCAKDAHGMYAGDWEWIHPRPYKRSQRMPKRRGRKWKLTGDGFFWTTFQNACSITFDGMTSPALPAEDVSQD